MFLKRLELQGFKSFADKTVLDFSSGATAVVGPNGSGKSNISDAIRWVIGEMSAKSLRGSNMQDVIFTGTATRKPVNFAEVSLVLDNSDHIFNIEFDEVIVTRRLFRSGESVYKINKANCRLKDIHELFMDTGLGKEGYSIIGQGNVSQILSTKAEDRRSLFEEAAGVSKYKYRKKEALGKLEKTEENLVRINDITTELEGQIGPLKIQSEKARKYLDLYGEYKTLDVNLSLITIDRNKESAEEADKLYKQVEDELSAMREKESETERKISSLYDENKSKDAEKTENNNRLIETEAKVSENKNFVSIAQNDIKNNNSMLKRIDEEISLIKQRNNNKSEQISSYEKDIKDKETEAEIILAEFDTMKSESGDMENEQEKLHSEIEALKGDIIERLNDISSKKARINGMETLRDSFLERKGVVEAEIKKFTEGVENTKKEIRETQERVDLKKQKRDKLKNSIDELRASSEKINLQMSDITNLFNSQNVEYNSKTSKKRILEGMENDYAGYAKSVKAVLKAPELKRLSIYGTISGLIDVKKEYVIAIETALGGAMQNIIVESETDAKEAIAYLRRTNGGRATFLPVSSVKGRALENIASVGRSPGFIGLASELISYDKKYDGIIKSLLGRVVVVDNIDNAIAMSRSFGYKFRVVTLEGDILNSGGSMSGGSVNKQSGFLSRATEIKTLSKEINELILSLKSLRAKRENAESDLRRINNSLSSYMPMMREYEDEILKMENTVSHLKISLESGGNTEQNYRMELEQLEVQLKDSSEEIASVLQDLRSIENEKDSIQEKISRLEEEYGKVSSKKDEKSKMIMDKTIVLGALQKDIKMIKESIISLKNDIEQGICEIKNKETDKEAIRTSIDGLYTSIRERDSLVLELSTLSEEIKKKIISIDEQKAKITDTLKNIQSSNKELTDKLLQLQQELSRVDNKRVKLNIERENTINRLWDEYELTYSSASEIKTEVENEREASKRLSALKGQIKALGSVNVDAIEEYKNVKERFEFLSSQKADLEKSKGNLNNIIASMEELMEEHFGKQFAVINESFSEVFTELFGGGKGQLHLSDPDNMLESGIEIEVQLPGKGLQNINLYSGGEKSFIAIALLFAILKVKPTPFCILDEIDAALDDVNVSRFATYLKNYIDQTQFIIITHRRGTMEAANILYGVTMQEKGVSKLLSLHIDDVADDLVR